MSTFIVIAILVLAFGVFGGLYLRRRGMSFTGTVTDKDIHEEQVNNTNTQGVSIGNNNVLHVYKVKVQTDAGKSISWQVSEGKYQIIKIGDKVSKRPGTTDLDIISQAPPAPTTTPPSQPV